MTEAEVQEIEEQLGVRLPNGYREALRQVKPSSMHNDGDDFEFYRNPAELIRLNLEIHPLIKDQAGDETAARLHLIGSDGGGGFYFVDSSVPSLPVYWAEEFERPFEFKQSESLCEWVSRCRREPGNIGWSKFRTALAKWFAVGLAALVLLVVLILTFVALLK